MPHHGHPHHWSDVTDLIWETPFLSTYNLMTSLSKETILTFGHGYFLHPLTFTFSTFWWTVCTSPDIQIFVFWWAFFYIPWTSHSRGYVMQCGEAYIGERECRTFLFHSILTFLITCKSSFSKWSSIHVFPCPIRTPILICISFLHHCQYLWCTKPQLTEKVKYTSIKDMLSLNTFHQMQPEYMGCAYISINQQAPLIHWQVWFFFFIMFWTWIQ